MQMRIPIKIINHNFGITKISEMDMELKDIVHQGWLYKESRFLKRWKR